MLKQGKTYIRTRMVVIISVIIIAAAVTVAGCKKKPAEPPNKEHNHPSSGPVTKGAPKTSLNNIIRAARTWRPAYTSWYGKTAPDFTLTDTAGKKHKLSDYRGKDVILVFWATWCAPCKVEIPHLIELRNTISEDNLAILAISREDPALVKSFAAWAKINYTVLLNRGYIPSPYNNVTYIPCSFFIDPEGKIKLATVGPLSLNSINAILKAE